jgi:hypothetical protein
MLAAKGNKQLSAAKELASALACSCMTLLTTRRCAHANVQAVVITCKDMLLCRQNRFKDSSLSLHDASCLSLRVSHQ